ncbi:MAG TPA: folylpolyglutamate synthase/dihydrofolate synthase family protein [Patescibacteria group bacterium]|nr:folylpolyglutamate synthase/dihydrofolate synthase family protein [Patescibacteria group bacterium]
MSIHTYSDAQKYLESLIPNAQNKRYTNMRLERIEHILRLINNPHHSFQSIHVGGTSGKGSTAYLISRLLTTAGYKIGLHISPHLQTVNERMQINNQPISNQEFTDLVNWIKPYVDKVEENNLYGTPSYFEVLVALSFEYFKRKKVDLAVIEVGLGGTLDATNVINPLIAIITNVSLDHIEILGDTIEKIAEDKSGIIKNNSLVITGATQKTVIDSIKKKCFEKNASLVIVDTDARYQIKKSTINGSLFDLQTNNCQYHDLKLSLLGRHQVKNAICAILAVESLEKYQFTIDEKHIRRAFSTAFFAGRMEIVRHNPTIILDGAHNPAKMNALAEAMHELFHQKVIVVIGFKQKKDSDGMISALLPIVHRFIITTFSTMTDTGKNLSTHPLKIAKIVEKHAPSLPYIHMPTATAAIEYILKQSDPNDIILITGSLYLVGEIRSILKNKS